METATTDAPFWVMSACTLNPYTYSFAQKPAGADASYLQYFVLDQSSSLFFTASPTMATIVGMYEIKVEATLVEDTSISFAKYLKFTVNPCAPDLTFTAIDQTYTIGDTVATV